MPAIVNLVKTTVRSIGIGNGKIPTSQSPADEAPTIPDNWWPTAPTATPIPITPKVPAQAHTAEHNQSANTTPVFRDRAGNEYRTGALIGKGGEGAVYEIAGHPQSAAKIWHPNTDRHAAARKLKIMTHRGPVSTPRQDIQIIWPQTLLYDTAQKPAGYLMPRLQPNRWEPILKYYTPALAKQLAKERGQTISMTLRNLMARNICHAVHAIHRAGYVIGDINENNILATPEGCIAIIDCDSFQVRDPNGTAFPVTKIRPEFQPPELQNIPGRNITRQPNHDAFALAVLLFKLLCQGLHPYDGTVKDPTRHPDLNTQAQRIKAGIFYPDRPDVLQVSADWQRHWDDLNPPTQSRFIKTFTSGQRPQPDDWLPALTESQQDQGRQTIAPVATAADRAATYVSQQHQERQTIAPQSPAPSAKPSQSPPAKHSPPPPATPCTPADATGTTIWHQWRPGQQEACTAVNRFLDDPNCQVMALTAPAGSGKTLLAAAAAHSAQKRGLTVALLTPRRALQEQLMRDLQQVSKNLYGRARYECAYPEPLLEPLPETQPSTEIMQCRTGRGMADTAACRGAASRSREWNTQRKRWQLLQVATKPQQKAGAKELPVCPALNRCAYLKDLNALRDARFKIGNYALWQSWLGKNDSPFEGVGLLILDEAHVLPSAMESFQQVTITGRDLQLLPRNGAPTPYHEAIAKAGPSRKARQNAIQQFAITSGQLWQQWATNHLAAVKEQLESAKTNGDPIANRLDALADKLAKLSDIPEDGYICRVLLDQGGFKTTSAGWADVRPGHRGALWEIAPIAPQLAEFCGSSEIKVLLLSATLMPYFLDSIGAPSHQTIRHEVASSFPPDATPVSQIPEALSMAYQELNPSIPGHPEAEAEERAAIREERLTMWQTALLERAPRKTLFLSSTHRYVASDDWGIAHRLPHELVHWNSDSDSLPAACESFADTTAGVLATASIQFGADSHTTPPAPS